jgi:hypothetical protein
MRDHRNALTTRQAAAVDATAVVIHPSVLVSRLFTRAPTTLRSLVINIIRKSNGGTEKPWTIPDQTSIFIGLRPRKFSSTADKVTVAIVT